MNQRILVLGSTGNVGKPLVQSLVAAGEIVVAASRHPDLANSHQNLQQVRFDFSDPSTFAPALENVDRVYFVAPSGYLDSYTLATPFFDAAFASPRKFVLQTADGVQFFDQAPLRRLELRLEASGHPYVLLRPTWFMDNFRNFWRASILENDTISVPAGNSRTAFIDVLDIADAASSALRSDQFNGQAFSLTGPEALTYAEAAEILSRHAKRPIRYQHAEDADFIQYLTKGGLLPQDYAEFLTAFGAVRQGAASQVTDSVQQITGQAPRTLESYAQRFASSFAG